MKELIISEEAREYITRKGGVIHLVVYGRSSLCCGKVGFPPSVEIGVPKNEADYELQNSNGIGFYVAKGCSLPNTLTIGLHRTFGISSLHIEGWKLI